MPVTYEALLTERDGLIAQHHRDSAELRNLCAARDEARKQRDTMRDALDDLIEKANESDDCHYGTLSTTFVRDIARAAISK